MSPARSTLSVGERIAARMFVGDERKPGIGPCWEWAGARSDNGYATIKLRDPRRTEYVHRLVYAAEHPGDSLGGMHVDHRCHNHGCVRGSHLRLLTPTQNKQHRQGPNSTTQTGVRGVSKRRNGFRVVARSDGQQHYGGDYATLQEATAASVALRRRLGMVES